MSINPKAVAIKAYWLEKQLRVRSLAYINNVTLHNSALLSDRLSGEIAVIVANERTFQLNFQNSMRISMKFENNKTSTGCSKPSCSQLYNICKLRTHLWTFHSMSNICCRPLPSFHKTICASHLSGLSVKFNFSLHIDERICFLKLHSSIFLLLLFSLFFNWFYSEWLCVLIRVDFPSCRGPEAWNHSLKNIRCFKNSAWLAWFG